MRYLLCFLIAMPVAYCQAQVKSLNYKKGIVADYKLSYYPDSLNRIQRTELLTLRIYNDSSVFRSKAAMARDSVNALFSAKYSVMNNETAQLYGSLLPSMPNPKFSYTIYKSPANKSITFFDGVGGKAYYRYTEPISNFQWHILPETSNIAGYTCQKATTTYGGRTFDAWFTRALPVSDGPYKFAGLPGLIIKVADSHRNYSFELVRLKQVPAERHFIFHIARPSVATNRQQFNSAVRAANANTISDMEASGNTFSEDEKKTIRENIKKRNNPLELD